MKKHKRKKVLSFYDKIERILMLYGDYDTKDKLDFVKNFIKENFQVDQFDNTYLAFERLHSKRLLWLLFSLISNYETLKQNPKEQLSKLNGLVDSPPQKVKMPEEMERQEKYMSLEVDAICPIQELTEREVEFIEPILDHIKFDFDSEFKIRYIISATDLICLIRGIMAEHAIFLGYGKKLEE